MSPFLALSVCVQRSVCFYEMYVCMCVGTSVCGGVCVSACVYVCVSSRNVAQTVSFGPNRNREVLGSRFCSPISGGQWFSVLKLWEWQNH